MNAGCLVSQWITDRQPRKSEISRRHGWKCNHHAVAQCIQLASRQSRDSKWKRYEIRVMQNSPTRTTHEPKLVNMDHAEARTLQYEPRKTLTGGCSDSHESYNGTNAESSILLENVKAHPPLGARANVEHGVEVVVIIKAAEQGGS